MEKNVSEMNPGLTRRLSRPSVQVKDHLPISVPWSNRVPTQKEMELNPRVLVNEYDGVAVMSLSQMVEKFKGIYWARLDILQSRVIQKVTRFRASRNGLVDLEGNLRDLLFEDLFGADNEEAYIVLADKINSTIESIITEEMINTAYRLQDDESVVEEASMAGDLC